MFGVLFSVARLLLGYIVLLVLMVPLVVLSHVLPTKVFGRLGLERLAWYVLLLCDYIVPVESAFETED
jgi:hypothetical protein